MAIDEEETIQLSKLMDLNESNERKITIINKLRELEIDYFENNIRLIIDIARFLEERCLTTFLEPECNLFKYYLETISEQATYSIRKGNKVKEYIVELFREKFEKVPDNIKLLILNSLNFLVKTFLDIMVNIQDIFMEFLKTTDNLTLLKKGFTIIGDAAWLMPQILVDYIPVMREIIKEKESKELEALYYLTISKAARRNYYVVKSIIYELLNELYTNVDPSKLVFLSNIDIPPEHMDLASNIFDLLETHYRETEDPHIKISIIQVLAKVSKDRDFYEIQERFNRFLIDSLNEEINQDIKLTLIRASALPQWNHRINLDELLNNLVETAVSSAEDEEIRIAAINSLFKISLLPYSPKERIINGFIDILYESGGEEPKSYVLDYIPMLLKSSETKSQELINLLVEFIGKVEEEDFLRIKAADLLVSISRHMFENIMKVSDTIHDVWRIATEWTVRDSLVKLAGELLVRSNTSDENLLSILIDALRDTYIYREALMYIYMISRRAPEVIVNYIDEIIDTYKTISSVEGEMLEATEQEGFSEDYYFMVETPKRIIPRILLNIIKHESKNYEKVIDQLLDQFESEINELILRELAFSLSQAYELDRDKFKGIITKHLLRKDRIELLKEFGVIL